MHGQSLAILSLNTSHYLFSAQHTAILISLSLLLNLHEMICLPLEGSKLDIDNSFIWSRVSVHLANVSHSFSF